MTLEAENSLESRQVKQCMVQICLQEKQRCCLCCIHLYYFVEEDENLSIRSDRTVSALIFTELYQVPVVGVTVPIMWFYLFMNVITQYPLHSSASVILAQEHLFFSSKVQGHEFWSRPDLFCSKQETGPSTELLRGAQGQ